MLVGDFILVIYVGFVEWVGVDLYFGFVNGGDIDYVW